MTAAEQPWAADAARLLRSVQQVLAADAGGDGPGATPGMHGESGAAGAAHPAECRHCPLCQAGALVRRAGPDLLEGLAVVATGLAAALRRADQADQADRADTARTDEDRTAGREPGDRAAAPEVDLPAVRRTQWIDVTE